MKTPRAVTHWCLFPALVTSVSGQGTEQKSVEEIHDRIVSVSGLFDAAETTLGETLNGTGLLAPYSNRSTTILRLRETLRQSTGLLSVSRPWIIRQTKSFEPYQWIRSSVGFFPNGRPAFVMSAGTTLEASATGTIFQYFDGGFGEVLTNNFAFDVDLSFTPSGRPGVITSSFDIRYLKNSGDGNGWVSTTLSEEMPRIGFQLVHDANDDALVAYRRDDTGVLKFIRFNGANSTVETIDGTQDTGMAISLAVVGDMPAVAYHRAASTDLLYARRGATAWDLESVATAGAVGSSCVLMNAPGGIPWIAFRDDTGSAVKIARRLSPSNWGIETIEANQGDPDFGKDIVLCLLPDGMVVMGWTSSAGIRIAHFSGSVKRIATIPGTAGMVGLRLDAAPDGTLAMVANKLSLNTVGDESLNLFMLYRPQMPSFLDSP